MPLHVLVMPILFKPKLVIGGLSSWDADHIVHLKKDILIPEGKHFWLL